MRKNLKKLAFFVTLAIGISLSFPVCLFAYEQKSVYSPGKLVIRQETYSVNEVSVCQPSPLDTEIVHLINKNNIRSVEDYANWLQKNIRYEKDKGKDAWAAPQITLKRKYGDCEHYALLNIDVMKMIGNQCIILLMKVCGHFFSVFSYTTLFRPVRYIYNIRITHDCGHVFRYKFNTNLLHSHRKIYN